MERRGPLAIAVTAATILVCAIPAAAAPPGFFGITKGQPLDRRDFDMLGATGIGSVRFAINWYAVQPHQRSEKWTLTDKLVGNLAARGIQPLPFIYGSPRWVAEAPRWPPLASAHDVNAWRAFLALAVERYGPGGAYWNGPYQRTHPGATPEPITAWQVWNEPNLRKFFPPKGKAPRYAKLVKISYAAITAADPNATVVLAGMPGYGQPDAWTFLDHLYRVDGIKNSFDAAAVHPYAATIGQFRSEIVHVRSVMRRHHDAATPLWLTELGWGSAHPTHRWPLNKGSRGQSRMLARSFGLVLRHRTSWRIGRLFWFDWRDPRNGRGHYCSFCDSAGLLQHNHRPKPAYGAYRRFAQAG
jgi:hypothetical protein